MPMASGQKQSVWAHEGSGIMSDFIELCMKEFDKQFDEKFGDMSFIKTREIEDLQDGVKKLCNRIDELEAKNAELREINEVMYKVLKIQCENCIHRRFIVGKGLNGCAIKDCYVAMALRKAETR